MKLRGKQPQLRAMTLTEVLVVLFVVVVLGAAFLPLLARSRIRSNRIGCVDELRDIGLAYKIWTGDNQDKYPSELSVTNGGAMELAATGNVVAVFQCMSNELSTPKILVCPDDASHHWATNFSVNFTAKNISYFAGLDTDPSQPQGILSGDDNLLINGQPVRPGVLNLGTNSATWSPDRHKNAGMLSFGRYYGNVLLSDGSVQGSLLQLRFGSAPDTVFCTNRLAIP